MHAPINEFQSIITSVADGTQPATTYGTSITPGITNAYGSYASVMSGATLTSDAYGLEIVIHSAYTNTVSRGMLVTIGFDPAGGTSFGGLGGVTGNEISNLLCSGAYTWYTNGAAGAGHRFYFPIFIKSGTSIGAKAQTSDGTAGTIRVAVKAFCKPSRPDAIRVGSFVRTFGAVTATTDGTAITQGTAAEGAWTSIGTAADALWYIETGLGCKTATGVNALSHSDVGIGDASNKRTVIQDLYLNSTDVESTMKLGPSNAYCLIKSGDIIYGRSQATAAQTGFSMTVHAVGG